MSDTTVPIPSGSPLVKNLGHANRHRNKHGWSGELTFGAEKDLVTHLKNIRFGYFKPKWREHYYLKAPAMQEFAALTLRLGVQGWHQRRCLKLWATLPSRKGVKTFVQEGIDRKKFSVPVAPKLDSSNQEWMEILESFQSWAHKNGNGFLDLVSMQKNDDARAVAALKKANIQNKKNVSPLFKST